MAHPAQLHGEPDVALGGLSVWVLGWEFPDSDDFWDGNWLRAIAQVEAPGARVTVEGAWLRNTEVMIFLEGLVALNTGLKGLAELACLEPNVQVSVECTTLGQVAVAVEITPNQLTQEHKFAFSTDQTFLAPAISGCRRLLQRFPIRGEVPS